MYTRRIVLFAISSLLSLAAQEAAAIQIGGAVKEPITLTAADLAKLPRATITTNSDGIAVVYEGVWLHEVLKKAGAPGGTELRGKALASYVLAEAKDGYQVLFSLAEIDPVFTGNEVLLADQADGKPLIGSQGPFRLVAPKDKRGARSIRMLTKLDVVTLRK
jgi:hypothetical protein